MEKIKGHEGKTIRKIDREEAERMLYGGAYELYSLYEICATAWYYQKYPQNDKDKKNSEMAEEYRKKAEGALKEIMQKKGYPIEKKNSFDDEQDEYIHFTGGVRVHQLPFTDKWNINIGKYLFDEKGELKTWAGVMDSIREDMRLESEARSEDIAMAKILLEKHGISVDLERRR